MKNISRSLISIIGLENFFYLKFQIYFFLKNIIESLYLDIFIIPIIGEIIKNQVTMSQQVVGDLI